MKRKIEQYQNCDPKAMAHNISDAAQHFAFEDMKADILELHAENQRFRAILRQIAYPKRGTTEERMDVYEFANLIQSAYTRDQLEGEE